MRILVTGCAGFIAARVAQLLLDRGDEVVGVDNLNDYYPVRLKEWRLRRLQQSARFEGAREVVTIDGLRVEYPDGFGLARASNTTPVIVLRFEADNAAALSRIQEDFRKVLKSAAPQAELPF